MIVTTTGENVPGHGVVRTLGPGLFHGVVVRSRGVSGNISSRYARSSAARSPNMRDWWRTPATRSIESVWLLSRWAPMRWR